MLIVIPGTPLANKSHQDSRHKATKVTSTGKIVTYSIKFDPLANEKKAIKFLIKKQFEEALSSENEEIKLNASNLQLVDAFFLAIRWYFPIRVSFTKSKKRAILESLIPYNQKPDIDNLEKFYLDCIKNIIIPDDRQVVEVHKFKAYSREPRTEILILPWGNKNILTKESQNVNNA